MSQDTEQPIATMKAIEAIAELFALVPPHLRSHARGLIKIIADEMRYMGEHYPTPAKDDSEGTGDV